MFLVTLRALVSTAITSNVFFDKFQKFVRRPTALGTKAPFPLHPYPILREQNQTYC